ncbi:unnamed protein product [Effrenium voratum]|nr:unnamed protein product [Effrenium voratum]
MADKLTRVATEAAASGVDLPPGPACAAWSRTACKRRGGRRMTRRRRSVRSQRLRRELGARATATSGPRLPPNGRRLMPKAGPAAWRRSWRRRARETSPVPRIEPPAEKDKDRRGSAGILAKDESDGEGKRPAWMDSGDEKAPSPKKGEADGPNSESKATKEEQELDYMSQPLVPAEKPAAKKPVSQALAGQPPRASITNPFHARLLAQQQREKERAEADAKAKAEADEKAKQEEEVRQKEQHLKAQGDLKSRMEEEKNRREAELRKVAEAAKTPGMVPMPGMQPFQPGRLMAPGMAPPMGGPGGMGAMPMGAISKAGVPPVKGAGKGGSEGTIAALRNMFAPASDNLEGAHGLALDHEV